MQFLKLDDAVLHYAEIGAKPEKPTIVFINALGTDFRIWRDVVVRLVGEFSIINYDMRGHGLSGTGEGEVSIARHAEDLAALLDHLKTGPVFVCGLSIGGLVAQELYADRRDLVRALILCGTGSKIGDSETWNARIAGIEANGIEPLASAILPRWFSPAWSAANPETVEGYRNMLTRQSPRGYIASCAALRDADLTEAARQIAAPTLCVAGENDGSTPPELMQSLAKSIPGARYELIAGAGHIMCVEEAEKLTAIIFAFADQVMKWRSLN